MIRMVLFLLVHLLRSQNVARTPEPVVSAYNICTVTTHTLVSLVDKNRILTDEHGLATTNRDPRQIMKTIY